MDPLNPDRSTHVGHMEQCLALAEQAPALATNYCVGALLFDPATSQILETGFTMEMEGNTHAEQCCLEKMKDPWPETGVWLYTTMEPCVTRLSGQKSCVNRIIESSLLGRPISVVFVGVLEPEKFVQGNNGRSLLEAAGVKVVHVGGLEKDILQVATSGHPK